MFLIEIHFGAKTSRYGPHELGYRRATRAKQSDAIPSLPSIRYSPLLSAAPLRQGWMRLLKQGGRSAKQFLAEGNKVELIMKYSYLYYILTNCHLKLGDMKKEFRVIVDNYATVKC